MGEVYRARDSKLGRDVALKILPSLVSTDPDRLARFEREAKTLAALNHINIAHIYDAGREGEHAFLVMELVEGEDLSALINRGLPLSHALPIARQIADALECAHENGIVHRDLKPANVKVRDDGTVKVLDFGLAKALTPDSAPGSQDSQNSPTLTNRATQMGMILGTAAYMAPEQARGRVVDRRADIWAFGVVLYEMLSGRRAFDGDDVSITLAGVLKEDVNWDALPADLPVSIRRLLRRCLEKDPKRRLGAISDARLEIDEATSPPDVGPSQAAPSGIGRNERRIWASVAGIALLAAGVFAWRSTGVSESTPAIARFAVFPPGDGQFSGAAPRMAISPDGQALVFAVSQGSSDRLWMRRLDSVEVAPVAGTESGPHGLQPQSPFWSPDGRHLAFFFNTDTAGKGESRLRIVDMLGGSVRQVAVLPSNNPGGSWNSDGVILVSSEGSRGIQRIPAGGGALTPVTTLDQARNEIAHLWPQFLPDGRHFLYLSQTKDRTNWAIFAGSIDSSERRQVIQAEYARFAAPDLLLYVKGDNLLTQVMDLGTRTLTGEPVSVATGISLMLNNGRAAFAVSDTGVLVYSSNPEAQLKSGVPDRQLTWMDRNGKPLGTAGALTTASRLRLSPDAMRVALIESVPGRVAGLSGALWVRDLGREVQAPLTPANLLTASPAWSSDSARVLFGSIVEGGGVTIVERASSGATPSKPVHGQPGSNVMPLDESSDGNVVVFSSGKGGVRSLHILSRPTGKSSTYLSGDFDYPQASLSSDGKWLAYVSNESGEHEVIVQPFPDPSGGKWQISTRGGIYPRWRRDGSELFYVDSEDRLVAVPVTTSRDFSPGRETTLFSLPRGAPRVPIGAAYPYDVAPNGQRFLVSVPTSRSSVIPLMVTTNWTTLLKK